MHQFLLTALNLGWLIIWPLLWTLIISIVPSLLFSAIRRWWLERAAFGTELFAMLFAVDLMVVFGLVQAWLLSACAKGPTWYCDGLAMAEWMYRTAALVLLLTTVFAAIVAVQYERLSIKLWQDRQAEEAAAGELWAPWFKVDRWWMRAAMLRWTISWLHLLWIVKAPKSGLFL